MDKRLFTLLALALLASGCTLPGNTTPGGNGGGGGPSLAQDRGLRITEFRPTDETLRPSQTAIINVRLKNYHTADTDIQNITIYNEGLLSVSNKNCSPSIGNLGEASAGTYPEMHCQWRLEAPPESEYTSFESKPASMNLRLVYNTSLTNHQPFKVQFKPLAEINSSNSISGSFANSEVRMKVSTENPIPVEQGRTISIVTKEIGKGRIAADTDYRFSFSPRSVFGDGCYKSDSPTIGKTVEFSCEITGGQQGTRNLIFSTSYKYVKEPVLNIKLVNNQ